jgi:hypothetical protein
MNNFARMQGYEPYSIQASHRDVQNGIHGCLSHAYGFPTDLHSPEFSNALGARHVIKMTNVDYYVQWYDYLWTGQPVMAYTFTPTDPCGSEAELNWSAQIDNTIRMQVVGGGDYRHQLWDYAVDHVVASYPQFVRTYTCDIRRVSANWSVVLLALKHTGPPNGNLGVSLKRRQIAWPCVTMVGPSATAQIETVGTDGFLSLAQPGTNTSIRIPNKLRATIDARLRVGGLKPTDMAQLLTLDFGVDTRAAAAVVTTAYPVTPRPATLAVHVKEAKEAKLTDEDVSYRRVTTPAFVRDEKLTVTVISPPVVPSGFSPTSCRDNDIFTIEARVTDMNNPNDTFSAQRQMWAGEFIAFLIPTPGMCAPVDVDQVIASQTRPAQKLANARAAPFLCELAANDANVEVKSFQKKEIYPGLKPPRNISTLPTHHCLLYSTYTQGLAPLFKATPWYAFGMSPTAVAARVHAIAAQSTTITESDFSKFDGSHSEAFYQAELACYLRAYPASEHEMIRHVHSAMRNAAARTSLGVQYDIDGSRVSGAADTSLMNSFDNALLAYFTFRSMGQDPATAYAALGIYGGDDGLTGDIDTKKYVRQADDTGLVLKAYGRPANTPIGFLGRIYPTPSVAPANMADPLRQLSRLHLAATRDKAVANVALYNRASGFAITDAQTPILGAWARMVVALTPAEKRGSAEQSMLMRWINGVFAPGCAVAEFQALAPTRDAAMEVTIQSLGVSARDIEDYERHLSELKSIDDLRPLVSATSLELVVPPNVYLGKTAIPVVTRMATPVKCDRGCGTASCEHRPAVLAAESKCRDCGGPLGLGLDERARLQGKGLALRKSCKPCIAARKERGADPAPANAMSGVVVTTEDGERLKFATDQAAHIATTTTMRAIFGRSELGHRTYETAFENGNVVWVDSPPTYPARYPGGGYCEGGTLPNDSHAIMLPGYREVFVCPGDGMSTMYGRCSHPSHLRGYRHLTPPVDLAPHGVPLLPLMYRNSGTTGVEPPPVSAHMITRPKNPASNRSRRQVARRALPACRPHVAAVISPQPAVVEEDKRGRTPAPYVAHPDTPAVPPVPSFPPPPLPAVLPSLFGAIPLPPPATAPGVAPVMHGLAMSADVPADHPQAWWDYDSLVGAGWPAGEWWRSPDADGIATRLAVQTLTVAPSPNCVVFACLPVQALQPLRDLGYALAVAPVSDEDLWHHLANSRPNQPSVESYHDMLLLQQKYVAELEITLPTLDCAKFLAPGRWVVLAVSGAGKSTIVRRWRKTKNDRHARAVAVFRSAVVFVLMLLLSTALGAAPDPSVGMGISQSSFSLNTTAATFPRDPSLYFTPEYDADFIDEPPFGQPPRRRNRTTQAALPVIAAAGNVVQKLIHPSEQIDRVSQFLRTSMPRNTKSRNASLAAYRRPTALRARRAARGGRPVRTTRPARPVRATRRVRGPQRAAGRRPVVYDPSPIVPVYTIEQPAAVKRPRIARPVARRAGGGIPSRAQPATRARVNHVAKVQIASTSHSAIVNGKDRVGVVTNRDNMIGQSLITFIINPQILGGERVRRLASTFDNFHFDYLRVHFSQAEGTQVPGEMLGWFEMDPVDSPPENDFGLKIGFAHDDSARTATNYEPQMWTMPRPLSGRYYMENNGSTASDKRLTQEGVFNLRTSVPTTLDPNTPVGSLWIEYRITMTKPTIQRDFVGSDDVYSAATTNGTGFATMFSQAIDPTVGNDLSIVQPYSNAGTTAVEGLNSAYAVIVPPGVWDFDITCDAGGWGVTSTAGLIAYEWAVSTDGGNTYTPISNYTTGCATNFFPVWAVSTSTAAFAVPCTWGTRVLVPNDGLTRMFFIQKSSISTSSADILASTFNDEAFFSASFSRVWATPSETAILDTSEMSMATLSRRLLKLERPGGERKALPPPAAASAAAPPLVVAEDDDLTVVTPPPSGRRPLGAAAAPASAAGRAHLRAA